MKKETKQTDSLENLFDFLKRTDSGLRNRVVVYWPDGWGPGMVSSYQKHGYLKDCIVFEDIEAFWEWIHHNEFDKIIMDVWKRENGQIVYDVNIIGKIRKDFPDCKIIVTSALNHFQAIALFLGADAFLTLPFLWNDLLSLIYE